MRVKLSGARDGKPVELPQDLDALVIETSKGAIYIDLGEVVPDMVMMRTSVSAGPGARLVFTPMDGRVAVGVIKG